MRAKLMILAAALLLAPLAALHAADAPARKPNVHLIVCDDLNGYIEGFGGHPQAKTPNLTRLRDSSVSFQQAHCTSPICAPSRASFLTGLYLTLVDLCGLTGDTRKNAQGRPLDGHSLKPFLLDPNAGTWAGPDAALTTLFRWAKTYTPSEQSYTLRSKDWRYIRYSNGKEELYDHVTDPHEWTNLAGNPEHAARLAIFRQQLTQRLPAAADNPAPQKTDVSRRSEDGRRSLERQVLPTTPRQEEL